MQKRDKTEIFRISKRKRGEIIPFKKEEIEGNWIAKQKIIPLQMFHIFTGRTGDQHGRHNERVGWDFRVVCQPVAITSISPTDQLVDH